MLIRLWWKDARTFGPAWLLLALFAGLLQWLMLLSWKEGQTIDLVTPALCWIVLYAFAVASAAFSSERESNTLGFLDALPVPRPMLWLGKMSFVFGSTAAMLVALLLMAELGTPDGQLRPENFWRETAESFAPVLFAGICWGLFWSALSRNTLMAAVLDVFSVAVVSIPIMGEAYRKDARWPYTDGRAIFWAILSVSIVASIALVASLVTLVWRPSSGWALLKNDTRVKPPKPIVIRGASTGACLFWLVAREGRGMALLVGLLALFDPFFNWSNERQIDIFSDLILAIITFLVAGVSVFGAENAVGNRQFLVQHGVKAEAVWSRRVLAWGMIMALISGVMFFLVGESRRDVARPPFLSTKDTSEILAILGLASFNAFAIGVLCGMAIRRRITAALVGLIACGCLLSAQLGLRAMEMIPIWSLSLVPLVLLAISAAWAGDWLYEPQGLRRWARLGLLIVVPFSLLIGSFIAQRGWGVADVGRSFSPSEFQDLELPAGQNAAVVYRKAIESIVSTDDLRLYQQDGQSSQVVDRPIRQSLFLEAALERIRRAITLAREASAMPRAEFVPFSRMSLFLDQTKLHVDMKILADLLALEARQRTRQGDLTGAWDDILAQFRLANHLVDPAPRVITLFGDWCAIHHQAVGLAFDWLADPRQKPELVRKALADLKSLPPLPDLRRCFRLESMLIERTLDLSGDELAMSLFSQQQRKDIPAIVFFQTAKIICAPWERERVRRIGRKIVGVDIASASLEAYKRDPRAFQNDIWDQDSILAPNILMWLPIHNNSDHRFDLETVGHRALLQALALLVWKFEHDGKDAEKLEVLVPGLLAELPLDPYSGKPFLYTKSVRQLPGQPLEGPKESRLIFSVGPDRCQDPDFIPFIEDGKIIRDDVIFAIP